MSLHVKHISLFEDVYHANDKQRFLFCIGLVQKEESSKQTHAQGTNIIQNNHVHQLTLWRILSVF